jgi:ribose transport system permease protein
VVACVWFLFRRTRLGVNIYAIGNDAEAARARGISLVRTRVGAYVLSGMFAAVAGLFLAATTTAGDATSADVFVLRSIAAVVLGGISFYGGRGSAIGCIAGAFTLTLLVNVLFQAGINPLYQEFYEGIFLVVAVVLGALVGRLVRVRT